MQFFPCKDAASADISDMNMWEKNFRMILSARFASIPVPVTPYGVPPKEPGFFNIYE
jgi:hypothetical protein